MNSHIRKISIGTDYKSNAMHYIVGQKVLNDSHEVSEIIFNSSDKSYSVYIKRNDEIYKWKQYNQHVPVSLEYNINF